MRAVLIDKYKKVIRDFEVPDDKEFMIIDVEMQPKIDPLATGFPFIERKIVRFDATSPAMIFTEHE